MLEAQLGVIPIGKSLHPSFFVLDRHPAEDISFTIVLELNDDGQPSAPEGTVSKHVLMGLSSLTVLKDPPPWIPAVTSHTTSAASEKAETHLIRAVNTGIIDVSSRLSRSTFNHQLILSPVTGCSSCPRVRREAETAGRGRGRFKGERETCRQGEGTYVIGVPCSTTSGWSETDPGHAIGMKPCLPQIKLCSKP